MNERLSKIGDEIANLNTSPDYKGKTRKIMDLTEKYVREVLALFHGIKHNAYCVPVLIYTVTRFCEDLAESYDKQVLRYNKKSVLKSVEEMKDLIEIKVEFERSK